MNPIGEQYSETDPKKKPPEPGAIVSADPQASDLKALGGRYCFAFRLGTVVVWGVSEDQARDICMLVKPFRYSLLRE